MTNSTIREVDEKKQGRDEVGVVGAGSEAEPGTTCAHVGAFLQHGSTQFRCLLPASLDFAALAEHLPGVALWEPKHRYKLAFVVHSVAVGSHRRHDWKRTDEAHGAPINVTLLRKMLGKGKRDFAKVAVESLVAWGILVQTKNHCAKKHARFYALAPAYASEPCVWRTFHAPNLAKKWAQREQQETEQHLVVSPVHRMIQQNLESVSISALGLTEAAQRAFSSAGEEAAWRMAVDEIAARPARLSTSPLSNRVFHAVANCPRGLRPHLLIDGERTAEVDMACAQFFLLLGLYPKGSAERARYASLFLGDFYRALFAEVCEMGEGALWGGSPSSWDGPEGDALRDAFKLRAIRKVLYERLYPAKVNHAVWRAFSSLAPELSSMIAQRRVSDSSTQEFNWEMQRREAELVLGHVIPSVSSRLPGCKPVSIHDGILCQRRFAEGVKVVLERETERLYGVRPLVRVKAGEQMVDELCS